MTGDVTKDGGNVWAWCSGGCARWYYLNDRTKPSCPVCLSLPTAYTAEDPQPDATAGVGDADSPVASAHCPSCSQWFLVHDATLDANFLCPLCLVRADATHWQHGEPRRERDTTA